MLEIGKTNIAIEVLWMPPSNLHFSLIFIHQRLPLYICQHNLQKAMDKEDFKRIAAIHLTCNSKK
jgi:hypothetical protein